MGELEKIFLVFHDEDNSIAIHGKLGWVDAFEYFLTVLTKQIAGWSPEFQRVTDLNSIRKLPANYLFMIISSKILFEDKSSRVFLEKIKKKLEEEKISEGKVLKIQKQYFPKSIEPPFLHFFKDYAFFKPNGLSETRSEYRDFFSNIEEKTYWVKITDLAYDLLAFSEKKTSGHLDISRYAVFLAETNTLAEKYRANLRRDLQSMGLGIEPGNTFADDPNEFIVKLDRSIKATDFSVHIIGNSFGSYISGTHHTKEEIQAKITENFSSVYKKDNHGAIYRRFFWFDKAGILSSEKISNFYKDLSAKMEDNIGTELIVSSWEEFKSLIFQYVSFELPLQKWRSGKPQTEADIVYFLYDKPDEKVAGKLIRDLRKKGYKVITSDFNEDILAVRHIHMESLKRFDYALIFAEKAGAQWINMKILDVFKAPGFGREKPVQNKLLILSNEFAETLNPVAKLFEIIRYDNPEDKILLKKCLEALSGKNHK